MAEFARRSCSGVEKMEVIALCELCGLCTAGAARSEGARGVEHDDPSVAVAVGDKDFVKRALRTSVQ